MSLIKGLLLGKLLSSSYDGDGKRGKAGYDEPYRLDNPNDEVAVDRDGTEFTPPVKTSQLPGDAWYCDADSVHYARLRKGDGSCAVCGKDLFRPIDG